MKLKEFKKGEVGVIERFDSQDPAYRQKLFRMGLTKNAEFEVVRKAPFGGPIEIEVKGSRVVLRSDEANVLEVAKK